VHEDLDQLTAFVEQVRADGLTDAVLLGMGGSSLAPEVFRRSYADARGLRLHVLDTTEPRTIAAVDRARSTSTARSSSCPRSRRHDRAETRCFKHFWAAKPDGRHFIAITDPDTKLGALASEHGFRRMFTNDPEIGGATRRCRTSPRPGGARRHRRRGPAARLEVAEQNCAVTTGQGNSACGWASRSRAGQARARQADARDRRADRGVGLWAEQLVAESTGKQGRGILPIADEPLAARMRTDRTASSCTCATPTRPTRARGGDQGARRRRPPDRDRQRARRGRPRAAVSSTAMFATAVVAGASDQPVRPAQRPVREPTPRGELAVTGSAFLATAACSAASTVGIESLDASPDPRCLSALLE